MAMCLDEREHLADDRVYESLAEKRLIVPGHWHAEVGNALTTNLRRQRLTFQSFDYALNNLRALRVITEPIPDVEDIAATVRRAFQSGLTFYDELYVRLAETRDIPLFTFDSQMRTAARQRGVAVLPP